MFLGLGREPGLGAWAMARARGLGCGPRSWAQARGSALGHGIEQFRGSEVISSEFGKAASDRDRRYVVRSKMPKNTSHTYPRSTYRPWEGGGFQDVEVSSFGVVSGSCQGWRMGVEGRGLGLRMGLGGSLIGSWEGLAGGWA